MANIYSMVDTWNDGGTTFTAIKMDVTDTASSASSLLMDLQVGGVSKFRVKKDGTFSAPIGTLSAPTFSLANDDDSGLNFSASYIEFVYSGTSRGIAGVDDGAAMFKLPDSGFFGWSPNATVPSTSDLRLYRDAANTLAQRNSTNAQTFNLYNTYTDASNYERGFMKWISGSLEIGTERDGTGSTRNVFVRVGGTRSAIFSNTYVQFDVDFYPTQNIIMAAKYTEMAEMTAPAAPAANKVRIYAEDDGAGKTRLMALFPTGAAQQIAIEP